MDVSTLVFTLTGFAILLLFGGAIQDLRQQISDLAQRVDRLEATGMKNDSIIVSLRQSRHEANNRLNALGATLALHLRNRPIDDRLVRLLDPTVTPPIEPDEPHS